MQKRVYEQPTVDRIAVAPTNLLMVSGDGANDFVDPFWK